MAKKNIIDAGSMNDPDEVSEPDTFGNKADDDISDISEEASDSGLTNSGWADSVSKILKTNKPKRKRTIVLSKAKKLTDLKKEKPKPAGFEVQTADGKVKEGVVEVIKTDEITDPPQKKRRILPDPRIKPNILDKDRERTLQKIATKGVVQLFNAVKAQQKEISEKLKAAGPLEVRKEKVLKNIDKRAFLDVLMGEKSQKISDVDILKTESNNIKEKDNSESIWSVLKDDFMLSAKMKDWDKQLGDLDDINSVTDDQ